MGRGRAKEAKDKKRVGNMEIDFFVILK